MNFYTLSFLCPIIGVWANSLYIERAGQCLETTAFVLKDFNAVYQPENSTIVLDISGESSLALQSPYATITIETFGQQRYTQTFNPCSIGLYAFCPTSNGSFSSSAVLALDPGNVPLIPNIAYHVPDFYGNATLQVYDNTTNVNVVCITATITNGSSLNHTFISWISLVVFGLASITSFFQVMSSTNDLTTSDSVPSVYAVFAFFQAVVLGASISVNYPRIAVAWASNFAWSCGFILLNSLEASLNNFRNNSSRIIVGGLSKRMTPDSPGLPNPGIYQGLQGVLAQNGIATQNAFITTFCWFLILVTIVVTFLLGFRGTLACFRVKRMDKFRKGWRPYTIFSILRLMHLCFFLIMWLAIFQFTLPGDSAFKGVAVLVFLLFVSTLGFVCIYVYRQQQFGRVESDSQYPLYQDSWLQNRWGWLYLEFRREKWWFFGVELAYQFIRAVFYSVGQNHPLGQAVIILILESVGFLYLHVQRPFALYRMNLVFLGIQLLRVINTAFAFFYVPAFDIDPIFQYVLSLVCIFVQVFFFLAVVAMTFWNFGSTVYNFVLGVKGLEELGSNGTTSSLSEKRKSPDSSEAASRITVRDSMVQIPALVLPHQRFSASSGDSIDVIRAESGEHDIDRFGIDIAV